MPQVFKIGAYIVYFWIHEGFPLEPIHVHVAEGTPTQNATKIWITQTGKCLVSSNSSRIPERQLRIIMDVVEARHKEIEDLWIEKFGAIAYYC